MALSKRFSFIKSIIIVAIAFCSAQINSIAQGAPISFPEHEIQYHNLKRHPGKIAPNPLKHESESPDLYMEQGAKLGLKKVLPEPMNRNLSFSAGYDQWKKIPTLKADYLLPIKAWPDKTVLFQPRINLGHTNESLSLGLGFRQILTPEVMIGFHAFHDWVSPRFSAWDALKEAGVGFEIFGIAGLELRPHFFGESVFAS